MGSLLQEYNESHSSFPLRNMLHNIKKYILYIMQKAEEFTRAPW